MTYEDLWRALEQSQVGDTEGVLQRRIKPDAVCDLYLAVSKPANRRLLVMPVGNMSIATPGNLPSTRGIATTLVDDPSRGTMLQLALLDERFRGIFTALVTDIVDVVAPCMSVDAAVTAFIGRLERWQRLLQRAPTDSLGSEAQQGLYGELWFLRERLLTGPVDGRGAVAAWSGPSRATQDYRFPLCAIEVKTTGTGEPQRMTIHGERQLEATGAAELILFHLSLDGRESGSGESLVSMVASVRAALAPDPAAQDILDDRLLEAGYAPVHETLYEKTRYTVRDTHIFRVADGFPRIVGADLASGVGDVRYSIAVSACMPFAVTRDVLDALVTGVTDG